MDLITGKGLQVTRISGHYSVLVLREQICSLQDWEEGEEERLRKTIKVKLA